MISLKLLFIACLIFDFSLCINEANELKNTFEPSGTYSMHCKNSVGDIKMKGTWTNPANIPQSLSFPLNLKDGHNFTCSFTNKVPTNITCPIEHVKFTLDFSDTYMDANQEYLLKGFTGGSFNCLSSYIFSNLLLLFIIILILFT